MPKIASFLLKNRKIAQCWGLCPQTPMPLGDWGL